jgi:lysophospholipase L1-like esterase
MLAAPGVHVMPCAQNPPRRDQADRRPDMNRIALLNRLSCLGRRDGRHMTSCRVLALLVVLFAALGASAPARADDDAAATTYYLSLGNSLAVGEQPTGPPPLHHTDEGYADQLHAMLAAADPKLELVKIGCSGESTESMRFGSPPPEQVVSCGAPDFYLHRYPHKTQLAEAVAFLHAHKGKVALVTIDIGFNDTSRFDAAFNVINCFFEPQGCTTQLARVEANLTAILGELHAAAGPGVAIVGMTYYNVFEPLGDSELSARLGTLNRVLATTYTAAGVPVADVAGAFEGNVCAWTWFCTLGDVHPNSTGYAAIAQAFFEAITSRRDESPA